MQTDIYLNIACTEVRNRKGQFVYEYNQNILNNVQQNSSHVSVE
jgi:hypothetical protein